MFSSYTPWKWNRVHFRSLIKLLKVVTRSYGLLADSYFLPLPIRVDAHGCREGDKQGQIHSELRQAVHSPRLVIEWVGKDVVPCQPLNGFGIANICRACI